MAQRHSIQVQLRPSPYGGTLAIVLLPAALLRAADGTSIESNPATYEEAAGPVPAGSYASSFDGSAEPGEFGDLMSVGAPVAASSNGDGDDRPLMDDLPVFATIRSSWFVSEREATGDFDDSNHGELPRPRPQLNPAVEPDDWAELPGPSTRLPDLSGEWRQPPGTGPQPAEPTSHWAEPLGTSTRWATADFSDSGVSDRVHAPESPAFPPAPSFSQPSSFSPGPSSTPASALPPAETARTDTGLPKRKRRASLAPELRGTPPTEATTPPLLAGPRSPEEIRNMMSSFQANFGRGLQAGPNPNGDDDARKVM